MRPPSLLGLLPSELEALARELGASAYRGRQVATWLYRKGVLDLDAMTDLPKEFRERLRERARIGLPAVERVIPSRDGSQKFILRLADQGRVHSVLMPDEDRLTLCLSTQVGCGFACAFCHTGTMGIERNLGVDEIVGQLLLANAALPPHQRVTHLVFMGMGEPLANYASVLDAVRRMSDPVPSGFGISQRAITVSTVGLAPAIDRLAAEGLSVRLAVSLHAPDDDLRDELVPVNRRWKVAEVLDAAWGYAAATGRRVSIEYAMIRDINDQAWRADLLARRLAGRLVHVNLIPLNPTPGSKWTASAPAVAAEFEARLADRGIPVTVRDTRGREIDGACGQLAAADRDQPAQ